MLIFYIMVREKTKEKNQGENNLPNVYFPSEKSCY